MVQEDPEESLHHDRHWWRSPFFYGALFLGPLFWFSYALLNGHSAGSFALGWTYIVLVIVYPVLEEITFRGLIQTGLRRFEVLRRSVAGLTGANVVTSLVFVSAHLVLDLSLWSIAVFLPSIVFGWCFDRFKSLLPCVVLHVFYNAGFFILWPAS